MPFIAPIIPCSRCRLSFQLSVYHVLHLHFHNTWNTQHHLCNICIFCVALKVASKVSWQLRELQKQDNLSFVDMPTQASRRVINSAGRLLCTKSASTQNLLHHNTIIPHITLLDCKQCNKNKLQEPISIYTYFWKQYKKHCDPKTCDQT